jgi:UDP-N-acetylmuramate--alanine ligase
MVGQIEDRRVVTYGENPQADVRLLDVDLRGGVCKFRVVVRDRKTGRETSIDELELPMAGRHNALNATAAIAVAVELGIAPDRIRAGLAKFGGVKRRFTRVGAWNGVTIFDDYGHHPVEIAAVLKAARASTDAKVIAVVQPHRYSRLKALFDGFSSCFNDADTVIVADVYPAGEQPIEGAEKDDLVAGLRSRGHRHVVPLEGPQALAGVVAGIARPGDYVVLLGAGTSTYWAAALPEELAALGGGDAA